MRRFALALVVAALFRLWDGRTLEVDRFIRHGEEYVVTLSDGTTLILRQADVKEITQREPPR